jgi:hypothetical protein
MSDELQHGDLSSRARWDAIPGDVVSAMDQMMTQGQQFMAMPGSGGMWHVHYIGPIKVH